MCVYAQSLCYLMDCSPPGSSVHGIFQAKILDHVAIPNRDWTHLSCDSCTGRQILYHWDTWKAQLHVYLYIFWFFSCSVVFNSLQPDGLQRAKLPCPLLFPRVWPNSCSLSRWCHPAISSSVAPFSSFLQSFPTSGSFPMSWLFISGGQSTGDSDSAPVLPVNIQGWFLLGLTGLISLQSYMCVCVCVCVCVSLYSQLDNSTLF